MQNRAQKKSPSTPDELATAYQTFDCSHDCYRDGPDDRAPCRGAGLVIDLRGVVVAPEGADLDYFAFVNYTTLGYGDVTPVERWICLGR